MSILGADNPLTFKIFLLKIIMGTEPREEAKEVLETVTKKNQDAKDNLVELYEQMPRARTGNGKIRLN